MKIISVNSKNRRQICQQACSYIKSGGLVIARADTSYAILSLPSNDNAQSKMASIKHDRQGKMISVFVPGKKYITDTIYDPATKKFVDHLLPGMVTIITDAKRPGMRMIRRKTINQIIDRINMPLTATSANPSGQAPARNLADIKKYFDSIEGLVLYEGSMPLFPPSTLIKIEGATITVLRQGIVRIEHQDHLRL